LIFRHMPEMIVPDNQPGKSGRPFKHPKPSSDPVSVRSIANDSSIKWTKRTLAEGTKGPIYADVKCVRCVSCISSTKYGNYSIPGEEIWLYIRRYEDGTVKYFVSNASASTDQATLDRLSTMRWSIEQCFQECKSYLGMTHYETRTYPAWHRHMLMVMIAHLFTLKLRLTLKKSLYHNADGKISDRCCTTG